MNKKLLAIIAAIVFIVSYFLPFVSAMGFGISLFDIIQMVFGFGVVSLDAILFILAVVFALIVLILAATNKGTKWALYAGIFNLVVLVFSLVVGGAMGGTTAGVSLFSVLGIGFWLYVIGSIGLIAVAFVKKD